MDHISIRLISGEINMHILAGSTVKQVIMQTQNSLGLSMIPNYLSIDWNYIQQKTNIIKIRNNIDLDKIYIDNGVFNIIYQIPQIIYSCLISSFINAILRSLSLSEKDVLSVKSEKKLDNIVRRIEYVKRCLKIKSSIFVPPCSSPILFLEK